MEEALKAAAEPAAVAGEEVPKEPGKLNLTFKLQKKLTAHGKEIEEIKLREPTVADIIGYGNPVITHVRPKGASYITYDEEKMSDMMSTLGAVPLSTIRALHPQDWNTIAYALASFFVPDLAVLQKLSS